MNKNNYEIERALKQFDKQIKSESYFLYSAPDKSISYWEKKIFIASLNLTIKDWKEIRKGDYWEVRDKLSIDINRLKDYNKKVEAIIKLDKYILQKIYNYTKN